MPDTFETSIPYCAVGCVSRQGGRWIAPVGVDCGVFGQLWDLYPNLWGAVILALYVVLVLELLWIPLRSATVKVRL